jgi:N-acetylglucosamine transport system permease protein
MEKKQRNLFIALTVSPVLILYIVFFVYPCINAFYVSLFNWRGISLQMTFVGLDNFIRILKDAIFWKSLYNNIYIFILSSIVTFFISLFFAVILSKEYIKEKNVYRTLIYFPDAVPVVIIGVIWMMIYNPRFGLLNGLLETIGLGSLQRVWLGDTRTVLTSITVILIWSQIGFFMVLLLSGIQNIPISLYEAARIDGASEIQQVVKITIPLIWQLLRTTFIFFILSSYNFMFQVVHVVTSGGPDRASEVLGTYLYQKAFSHFQFGYGTAVGVLMLIVTMSKALLILKITDKETYEY